MFDESKERFCPCCDGKLDLYIHMAPTDQGEIKALLCGVCNVSYFRKEYYACIIAHNRQFLFVATGDLTLSKELVREDVHCYGFENNAIE